MRKFFTKFNMFLSVFLLVGVTFSIITIANAVTPNPGHPWSETGDGTFAVIGPTTLRTFTFPDSNASIAILGANTFTATQSIHGGNLWVCAGGACGTAVTTNPVNGNIVVENAVIFDNNFQLKQTGAKTVDMLDSGGTTILQFDELQ